MAVYYVTSVAPNGTASTTHHPTLNAAEKAMEDEKPRLLRKELLGVGVDRQDTSGEIHPIRSLTLTRYAGEDVVRNGENVFLNTIKELRRKGYSAQV